MKKNKVWIRLSFTYFFFLTLHFAYGQCDPPIITGYSMDAYCDYDCSGSIDIIVTGGTGPYSYEWDTGDNVEDPYNLCPGTYTVIVTDAAGCTAAAFFDVYSPSYLEVDMYVINNPVNNDGALGAYVNGGTGPYAYQWSTGETTAEIFNLPPGIYCLTVYDGNGCYYENCIELINNLEAVIEGPEQLCIGECGTYTGYDGIGGGGGGYSYVWYDDGGTILSTAASIDFCPNYSGTSILTLELSDFQGYISVAEFLIDVVTTIPLEIVSTSPASCPDNNSTSACDKTCANSTITYTVPGSQNMNLNWEVLGAESYEVDNNIVTVNWGGPGTGEINVMSGEVSGDACAMQLNCVQLQQAPSGSASVYHGGGPGPWTYLWSDSQTTQTIYNIQAGTYQVTVTNGTGQTGTCEVTIDSLDPSCQNSNLGLEFVNIIHPDCNQSNGGSIVLYPLNPGSNYSYDWSNGYSGSDLYDLPAGQYCVTITDQINGCTLDQCFIICDPQPMTIHTYMIEPPFAGNPAGSAGIQVFGGTPPYQYDWGFGPTSDPIITGLGEGSYAVVVTDANGCTTVAGVDIYSNPNCPINAYIEIDDQPSSCFINDGAITVNIVGGAAPFEIEWNDGPAINSLIRNDLGAGYYCVFVTDANNCLATACVSLDCNENLIPTSCIGLGSLCIDIIDEPHAQFSSDPPADVSNLIELCLGETVSFFNESENAENYVWQLGDGYSTASLDVTHAYTQSGVYDVLLIARNECFCFDTTSVKVLVSDSEIPDISCEGTVCTNEEVTYTTTADCNNFIWTITNGTISGGGGLTDDYVTVDWGVGPIGMVTLQVSSCTGDYCANPTSIQVPIITDGVPIVGPAKVCPGEIGTYSIPLWSATEYVWSASPFGEIKSGQASNTVTIKWNVEIATNDPQWVHVEYNNCYLECGGESTKDVSITPDFYLAGPIEVCEDGSSDYAAFDEISNAPVPCNWTVLDPGGVVFWTSNGATAVTIDWPLGAGKYTLMANAVNPDDYCTDDYTVFVNVNAGPPVVNGIDGQNSICPGEYYTYQVVSSQANVAFDWVINNGGVMTETSGSTINVEWGLSQPYELTVTQTSTAGLACESQPFTMTIQPIASVSLDGPTDVCIEATSQYTAPAIGNALYDWTISPTSAGSVLTGQGSDTIDIIWHEAGVAMVSVAVCGVSEDLPVTVYGYPEPIVMHPDTICIGTNGLVSTATAFSSYSWRNESGTQISAASTTNLGPGFYELVVTNSAGCEGQTTFRIHEYPLPVINISTPGLDFYCLSAGFPIPTLYALNTEEGYTYQWYQNGSPLGVFSNTYTPTGAGSFYVEVTDINGCTDFSNTFFLSENCGGGSGGGPPAPGVGCSGVDNIFSNGPTCDHGLFQNISTNYVPGSVQWNFDDPPSGANNFSNLENPEHFFTNAGFYGVQMAVEMLTGDICIIHKEFEVPAEANFDYVSTCPGLPVTFEDITNFTPGTTITNWDWDFGDPASGAANTSNLQHPEHIYDNVGTYTVTLTINAQTGCSSTITRDVTVLSPPVASFDAPNLSCEATALGFNINMTPGVISFEWDFGDPVSGGANTSQMANTFHAFSAPGVYDVKLKVYNIYGCTDSTTLTVPINQNNLSGLITMDPGSPICEGDDTDATAPPGGVSWIWSEGSTTETINSNVASVFTVTITDDLGCTYSPPEAVLDIIAQPEATIKVTEYNEYGQPADCFFNGYILCEGEDVFLSITGAGDYSYTWSNGQGGNEVIYDEEHGGTLSVGDHVFEVTVTDNVTGCTSVEGPFTITVNPVPTDIEIISFPPAPICEQTTAVFTVSNPDPDLTYLWSTGEYGLTITASTIGEYFVRGISSFGCEGESNIIGIYAAPNINLVPDGCHSRCTPDTVCLPNIPDIVSYQWYFNGAAIPAPAGTDPDFKPIESGAYHVDLYDVNGCQSTSNAFNIDLLPTDTSELELGACLGGSIEYAGEILLPGSVTEFHFDNQYGCDSMITVSVAADINYEEEVPLVACENGFVNYEGIDYFPGTTDTLELTSQLGCDSLVTIIVTALPTHADSLNFNACMGTTIAYEGENLTPGSTTLFSFVNQYGCDSTVTVSVLADPVYSDSIELSGCEGTTVEYEGVDYPVGTDQTFALNTIEGCDSTIYLNIEALPTYNELLELSACAGSMLSLPGGLEIAAGTDTTLFLMTNAGCDSTVQIVVEAIDTYEISVDLQTCEGSTVEYEGTDYPPGTDLEFNLLSQQGCDSTVYLTVEALPVQTDSLEFSTCTGSTIEYNGMDLEPGTTTEVVLTNQFGCDSTMMVTVTEDLSYSDTVQLSGCEGSMVNYEGVNYPVGTNQTFELQTVAGCDSTIQLNIEALPQYNELLELSTCAGSILSLPGGLELEAGADTTLFLMTDAGCDSTVQITVEAVNTFEINVDLQTCEGSTIDFEGTDYPPGTDLEFNYVSQQGCDSTVYLTVEALPVQSDSLELSTCTGTTVEYNGMDLEPGTTTEVVLTNQFGCDSTMLVTVSEDLLYENTVELSGCEGTMVNYEGIDYPVGTNQTFELQTVAGCDSTIHLNIEALSAYDELLELSTCTGSVLTLPGGLELEAGADTTLFLTSQGGCDSTVQITVEGVDGYEIDVDLEACDGSSVIYEGNSYPTGTDLEFNYLSQQGCDSTVYLTVEALPVQTSSLQLAACTGTTVEYNGSDLEPGSTTDFELTNQFGCDSTVTVTVIENLTYFEQIDLEGCDGEPVIFEGNPYPAGTIQELDYLTVAGCDSTIVLNIAALPLSEENLDLFACEGSTVEYNGDDLSPGTVLSYTFTNQFDCDSVVVVSVSELPVQNETVNLSGCDGQTVTFDGIDYPAGTQATLTFVNQYGCDSIINLNIAALPTYVTPITLQACVGESIEYNGDDLVVGSMTEYDLVSTDGCDSVVIITVEAYPTFDYEVNTSDIICWNSDTAYIEINALTGGTEPFNFSLDDFNYQDNPGWNNLGSGEYTVYVQDANGCVEETSVSIPEIPAIEMAFDVPLIECNADSVLLQSVLVSGFTDSMTYEWQHGFSGTTVPIYNPGTYILQATNLCETQNFEVEVALEDGYRENYFYIPNAFSPNNDGVNDIFKAYAADGLAITSYELHLFDRWGNTLYMTTDIDEGWNGLFLDETMNPGVYVWWLKARVVSCRNEIDIFEKGDVTIIK